MRLTNTNNAIFKKVVLSIFFLGNIFFSKAQIIQVLDAEDETPIEKVMVYNESKTSSFETDRNGNIDVRVFSKDETLYFQHLSYIEFSAKLTDILDFDKRVYLEATSEIMDEVVLTASRTKERRSRIAEQVEVIGLRKIQEQSPQTSADLLSMTPGVKVQKSQFGGGSPVLRGMEANRILLVVDGVRMNNAIYRNGHLQNSITVSPNLLDRAEVLFGPSSIMYGSDALGGVIHYYTKSPKLSETNQFNSTLFSRYSSVNSELSATYAAEYSAKKWASLTGISVSKFGDSKMGENRAHGFSDWGLVPYYSENTSNYYKEEPTENTDTNYQRNTGYSQVDLLQKFVVPINKTTKLNLNFQYSNSTDIPRFDKLNEYKNGALKYAEWYYGPQERFLSAAQIAFEPNAKLLQNGAITLSFQNINESRNERYFGNLKKKYSNENVKVYSLTGDFHVPLVKNEKRILSYGFETAFNKVASESYNKELIVDGNTITDWLSTSDALLSRYPDVGSSYSNFALYSNYRLDHSSTGTLNLGARYTATNLKAKWSNTFDEILSERDISLTNTAFSGTIGYAYKPTKNWQLNSVLSSGFRSPNIDDIGKVREKKGIVSVPNVHLKPEYAYNAEIGIAYYTNARKTMLGFNTYYTLLHNYIARDLFALNPSGTIYYDGEYLPTIANVNKGDAYIRGVTLSVKSKLTHNLRLNSSMTYTKGVSLDNTEPLSSIPPFFGDASLKYRLKKWQFGFDFRFNAEKLAKYYNIEEGIDNLDETPIINPDAADDIDKYYGVPAWQTYSLSSQYKLNQYATIRIKVDNILDTHYKEFASGVSAAGRNFSLSVNAQF